MAARNNNSKPGNVVVTKKRRKLDENDRRMRDADIVLRRIRRQTWSEISEAVDVPMSTCSDVWERHRKKADASFLQIDASQYLFETLESYDFVRSRLGQIAVDADNASAAVGALRAFMDATDEQMELMQTAGLLPTRLVQLRLERDAEDIVKMIIGVFKEHDVSMEVQDRIRELLNNEEASSNGTCSAEAA